MKKIFLALAILSSGMANAALIASGDQVRDTTSGYTWFKLTETTGMTYNAMQANLTNQSSRYYGYTFATKSDLTTLWSHAGASVGNTAANLAPVQQLFDLFGQTGTNCCARADGYYNDGDGDNMAGLGYLIPNYPNWWMGTTTTGLANMLDDFQHTDTLATGNGNTYGMWLYKVDTTSAVPEPGSVALFALGLLGLAVSRRKLRG